MQLITRLTYVIVLTALVVTVPWYVALVIIAASLAVTDWYELLVLALITDLLMGAGLQTFALPITTLCGSAIILIRALLIPHLISTHSSLHI